MTYLEKANQKVTASSQKVIGVPGAVSQAYNPSYLGGKDQKDQSSRSALVKSSPDTLLSNG
jgi:hypothetical protein